MGFIIYFYVVFITLLTYIIGIRALYYDVNENLTISLNCGKRVGNNESVVVDTKWLNPKGVDITLLSKRFSIAKNGYLIVKKVRREDHGLYTCNSRIMTSGGLTPTSVVVYLNVRYIPTITFIKASVEVYQNTSVLMPCSAVGIPGVTFQWLYRDGTVIKASDKYLLYGNGSLLIRNVRESDVFTYRCAPYNIIGKAVYGYTHLSILIPPKFLNAIKNKIFAEEYSVISVDCSAYGIPKPTISWFFLNGTLDAAQLLISRAGLLTFKNITLTDSGTYICIAESTAGKAKRYFEMIVLGKPGVPKKFSVTSFNNYVHISWEPSYNGGSPQVFELWYRASEKSDYEWVTKIHNSSRHMISLYGNDIAESRDSFHYYSMRARNTRGYCDFTPVVKAYALSGNRRLVGTVVKSLSKKPLEPYLFTVNISTQGYNLTWDYLITPGRPLINRFVIEYRAENSSKNWHEFSPHRITRRSISVDDSPKTMVDITASDIDVTSGLLEFQVYSVTVDNIRSKPTTPSNVYKSGMPSGGDKKVASKKSSEGEDEDVIPAIVLGIIFGLFVIILFISLYCFCQRRKRLKAKKNAAKSKNGSIKKSTTLEYTDGTKLSDTTKFSIDSPRKFHVRTCPALQLGKYNNNNNNINGVNGINKHQSDNVFILTEPNAKEKRICTCNKKYMTLDSKERSKKSSKKKVLYKSSSSPSVLVAYDTDTPLVDTSELLADEDFEVSEIDEDNVAELDNSRFSQLQRSEFKDSYDQFCKSESADVSYKDTSNTHVPNLEEPILVKCKKPSISKDADVSSSGTVESEIAAIAPSMKKETLRDSKSSDGKSSGYGDGYTSSRTSSNNFESFNPITRFVPLNCKSDIGYCSDNSSRLSPLEYVNNKYHPPQRNKFHSHGHNMQYFSEDEGMVHSILHRPTKPPSYTQAIVDIERMSEKSDKTDSEKSFDHLLEMERQLGVRILDDDDNDLTTTPLMTCRYRHSIPRNYFSDSGYTTDVQSGPWKDRYSNREKTLRCNQLLEEFKNHRKSNNASVDKQGDPTPAPLIRPYSVVDNTIPEEDSPVLKRRSSTSSYSEWLV